MKKFARAFLDAFRIVSFTKFGITPNVLLVGLALAITLTVYILINNLSQAFYETEINRQLKNQPHAAWFVENCEEFVNIYFEEKKINSTDVNLDCVMKGWLDLKKESQNKEEDGFNKNFVRDYYYENKGVLLSSPALLKLMSLTDDTLKIPERCNIKNVSNAIAIGKKFSEEHKLSVCDEVIDISPSKINPFDTSRIENQRFIISEVFDTKIDIFDKLAIISDESSMDYSQWTTEILVLKIKDLYYFDKERIKAIIDKIESKDIENALLGQYLKVPSIMDIRPVFEITETSDQIIDVINNIVLLLVFLNLCIIIAQVVQLKRKIFVTLRYNGFTQLSLIIYVFLTSVMLFLVCLLAAYVFSEIYILIYPEYFKFYKLYPHSFIEPVKMNIYVSIVLACAAYFIFFIKPVAKELYDVSQED